MKSTLLSFFLLCLLVSLPFSKADDLDLGIPREDHASDGSIKDGDQPQYSEAEMEQMAALEAQRLMLWGCYFFTKNLLYKVVDEVNELLASHPHKDNLQQKLVSDIMVDCLTKATPYDLQDLVKGYGQEEFDLKKWSHLHDYSRQKYEKMEGLETLTDQERIPYQYYEQIEQTIKDHLEKSGGQVYDDRNDIKIWGFSLQKISDVMKVVFITSLVGLLGIAVYNKLTNPPAQKLVRPSADEKDKLKKKEGKDEKEEKEEKKEKKESKKNKTE